MSSSTDPENLPPRRARQDGRGETGRPGDADNQATRSIDRTPADNATRPIDRTSAGDATRSYSEAPAASAERDYRQEVYAERTDPDRDYSDRSGSAATTRTAAVPAAAVDPNLADRETAVARQKEQFGGIKVGSAFFGWLTATGMAVLLTALVAAAGTAVGLANNTDVNEAVNQATRNSGTVGLVGIIVLLVILFVSYYSGGYVAGRMARFNGAKQGLMVWVWALIAAIVIAILGLVAGQQFNVLANLNSFPRIPINEGELTTTSIIAAVVVAVVALVGAVLGGLAGMHFHRKVDRAGFTPDNDYDE
ncbi:TIGR04086 family membrane protein [Pseudarthrobacter chlorophenolicus]|uniref:TIGR04086 family membrane protein n=1 Tax=Pseudarthrobacter chlorophenolicus TaxID=85085 RepID=UPI0005F2C871|nr:TIGR04086 family membrane protein [Pseudarthrobacter chlorophenolicus]